MEQIIDKLEKDTVVDAVKYAEMYPIEKSTSLVDAYFSTKIGQKLTQKMINESEYIEKNERKLSIQIGR